MHTYLCNLGFALAEIHLFLPVGMKETLKHQLDLQKLPEHIAIIMDGNGRWAKKEGKPRLLGHREGVQTVRVITETCAELGVKYLTLYAFSTENWNRPLLEITGLMDLLVETVRKEMATLHKNGIRLRSIGDLNALPVKTKLAMEEGIEQTKNNTGLQLILALNYSSRWEILKAVNQIAASAAQGQITYPINDQVFQEHLATSGIPDPELLIRTSGEHRISNFLLWQLAYTELYFTDDYWPEFRQEQLYAAILNYQQRERRFGKISEQLQK